MTGQNYPALPPRVEITKAHWDRAVEEIEQARTPSRKRKRIDRAAELAAINAELQALPWESNTR